MEFSIKCHNICIVPKSHFTGFTPPIPNPLHNSLHRDRVLNVNTPGGTPFSPILTKGMEVFIIRGKMRSKENTYRWVSV